MTLFTDKESFRRCTINQKEKPKPTRTTDKSKEGIRKGNGASFVFLREFFKGPKKIL